MFELCKDERSLIRPLCMGLKDDVVLWSCIESNNGKVWVDQRVNPTCAIVSFADFCFLLGFIVDEEDTSIKEILNESCKGRVILADSENWILKIEKLFPQRLKKYNRYAIKKEINIFDKKRLSGFILVIEPEYKIKRIDELIYYKALENDFTADFCCYFSSLTTI